MHRTESFGWQRGSQFIPEFCVFSIVLAWRHLPGARIWRWLLDFWKICGLMHYVCPFSTNSEKYPVWKIRAPRWCNLFCHAYVLYGIICGYQKCLMWVLRSFGRLAVINPLTPNERLRAVSPLKIKIPSKNMREKPTNTQIINSVY
jgi:hypothetical protein